MNFFKIIVTFFSLSILLIVYGYVCRSFNLYFFWESKYVGWFLLFLTLLTFLINRSKAKKEANRKRLVENIGIGIISFIIIIQIIFFVVISNYSALSVAKEFTKSNSQIIEKTGVIEGYFIIPRGSFSEWGNEATAEIQLIVKGAKAYLDIAYLMEKNNNAWAVVEFKEF